MAGILDPGCRRRLADAHPLLHAVVARTAAFGLCGVQIASVHVTADEQAARCRYGRSHVRPWHSPHNVLPSLAVDMVPAIDGTCALQLPGEGFRYAMLRFAGLVGAAAHEVGAEIRWGGDPDGNWCHDRWLEDALVHFELVVPAGEFARAVQETQDSGSWNTLWPA